MKWSFLSGDMNFEDYGGKFVSPPLNNVEFYYWLVLDVLNWENAVGEREAGEIDGTHNVTLSAVAPSECPVDALQSAIDSCGCENVDIDDPLILVELLHSYGIYATIWEKDGKLKDLLREGKEKAEIMGVTLFGFAMDCPQNAIGATGWDWLRGRSSRHNQGEFPTKK